MKKQILLLAVTECFRSRLKWTLRGSGFCNVVEASSIEELRFSFFRCRLEGKQNGSASPDLIVLEGSSKEDVLTFISWLREHESWRGLVLCSTPRSTWSAEDRQKLEGLGCETVAPIRAHGSAFKLLGLM